LKLTEEGDQAMLKKLLANFENISLASLSVGGLLVSVLGFFDWFGQGAWIANERLPMIILFFLSTMGLYIVRERQNTLDVIQKDVALLKEKPEQIIKALDGVQVIKFKDAFELLEYTAKRVRELLADGKSHWIDDTSWGGDLGYDAQLPKNQKISINYRELMLKFAKNHIHREIIIFERPHHRVDLKNHLENKEMGGYSCAYYKASPEVMLLKFMVIDDEEVILLADTFDGNITIKHPKIVKMFKTYYQSLWNNAEIIKDAMGIRKQVVETLNKEFAEIDPNFHIELQK
jgi:hypothetical protein